MTERTNDLRLSIVVPVYNEAENIAALYGKIDTVVKASLKLSYEIIFVDDGSDDGTFEILKTLHDKDNHVKVIRFRRNYGQSAALAAGFDISRGDVIVTMDGDLQNDPGDIPVLLQRLEEGFDIVSGWRKCRKDTLITRKIPSHIANFIISTVTGVKLHDYGCTLKAYRRNTVKNIHLYGELHRFIPALASLNGARIVEIPVAHHPRRHGVAKYGISRTLRVLLDLFTVEFLLRFSTRPMQIFGLFGLITGFTGFCIASYLTYLKLFRGAELAGRPLMLLAILLIVVGVQFIAMGLIGELIIRIYYESHDRKIYCIRDFLD